MSSIASRFAPVGLLGGLLSFAALAQDAPLVLEKEVSVDGGATWFDANDAGTAPTTAVGGGAMFRITLQNADTRTIGDVELDDPLLGISDFAVGDIDGGGSITFTPNEIPELFSQNFCSVAGSIENAASADGIGRGEDIVVANDSAFVNCETPEQVACWFTGGQNIRINVTRGRPEHSGGGNIYPSCSPLPGEGGQWTHTDHTQGLHFQARSLTVLECGNVAEIPPGAPSPAVTVNFIRATATGIIKGVGGNNMAEVPATATVVMEDWGEPGRNDKYTILATGGGAVISLDRAPLSNGGNFQIHQTSCHN